MKKLFIIIILVVCIAAVHAEVNSNSGTKGFKFLQIPVNPVSMSLAGRGVSSLSNPASCVLQPSIATINSHQDLSVSHTLWLEETSFTNIAYSNSDRVKHFGLILRSLDYGDVENRDDTGALLGYYNPLDMNLMANFGFRLNPSSYLGINAGLLYEKLNTASSYGFSTDLGYTYLPPITGTMISLAVRNLGYTAKMNEERIDLPISFEADISKDIQFEANRLSMGLSAIQATDEDFKGSLSAEFVFQNILSLRTGYKFNYTAEDITAGFGVKIKQFSVDYGWAAFNSELNDIHSFGITYSF
ncbi:MAG: hypothetical protein CVU48_05190 [Candidatus Cloacimonetes bacterium HGW-Cloacimonetes-1]|jgi:hypothetical protein|nr:MAG: hypothetical protein CVU48_05190 [Candidatus Cloacimonetes bacterium HGW-Cloacimonetes-1]